MLAIFHLLGTFIANLFKSQRRLEVENLFLRHQLNIALRGAPHRLRLRGSDRALLVWMTWLWPSLLGLSRVIQPDTILRWYRAGFRAYWRWRSRGRPGRPRVSRELHELIQRMSNCVSGVGAWSTTAALVRGDPARDRGVAAQQILEAFPWGTAPTYLVRDNDRAYG